MCLFDDLKAFCSIANNTQDMRMHARNTKGSSGTVSVRKLSRVGTPESGCNLAATKAHSTLGAPKLDMMDRYLSPWKSNVFKSHVWLASIRFVVKLALDWELQNKRYPQMSRQYKREYRISLVETHQPTPNYYIP